MPSYYRHLKIVLERTEDEDDGKVSWMVQPKVYLPLDMEAVGKITHPHSAYYLFMEHKWRSKKWRKLVNGQSLLEKFTTVTRAWVSLSENKKAKYLSLADTDLARFHEEMDLAGVSP